jgi:hypothetical protein
VSEESTKRVVVVLGMHRSGTSAVARGLLTMGVDLGDHLMPPVPGNNEKGFWEDLDINEMNVQMMNTLETDWYHLRPIRETEVQLLRGKGYFLRAVELLREKIRTRNIFGVKDPRIAKLLPFWKDVFSYCNLSISYVIAIRNPLSVAKSLAARDGLKTEQSYFLWGQHILGALANTRGHGRVIVDYDRLMCAPEAEICRIATGMQLVVDMDALQEYRNDFLDNSLRHTCYAPQDLSVDDSCPPLVRELYCSLLKTATEVTQGDDNDLGDPILSWVLEFERITPLFVLVDALDGDNKAAVKRYDAEITFRDGRIDELSREYDHAVVQRDDQIEHLNHQLAEREARIAGYEQALEQKNEELADLLHSQSWRITKPLRWCGQAARFLGVHLAKTSRQVCHALPFTSRQRAFLKGVYHRLAMLNAVTAKKETPCIHTAPSESPHTRAAMNSAPVRILMIERSVPKPDHDAGSLMIFNYIRVLRDLGCAVTFFPADMQYDAHYTRLLTDMGVTSVHAPDVCSLHEHLQTTGDVYDVVVSCRPDLTDPLIPVLRVQCPHAKLIYETHDLHFVREERHAELKKSNRLRKAASWRKKQELRIARGVDCTLVVSEEERDLLLQEDPALDVAVIPVVSEFFGCENGFFDRSDLVFIGGYEHQPNVDAVLYFVQEILPLIIHKQPEIRFHVVGSQPPDKILALASDNVIVHGFVPDISTLLNRIKISVNPLRFGAGVKGKLVTCMSYGLPCIGTSIAFEGMHATVGEQVLVADSAEDFAEEVLRLYADQSLWEKLSKGGMALIQEGFSLQTASQRFSAIFCNLLPTTPRHGLYLERIASREELQRPESCKNVHVRRRFEEALATGEDPVLTPGYCFVCDRDVIFQTQFEKQRELPGQGSMHSSWDEGVVCPICELNSRMRAMIHLFHLLSAPSLENSIQLVADDSSPVAVWFRQHYPYVSVKNETLADTAADTASDCDPGYLSSRTRCTSFASGQGDLDTILFSPVIRDYSRSISLFQDFLASLKPGGALFFSGVFESRAVHDFSRINGREMSCVSCKSFPDGVDDMGRLREIPCAWDLMDNLREMGFHDVSLYACWSQRFGYLGGDVFLARAVKRI